MASNRGVVRREGERRGVRFERAYAASVEELWDALTSPASVGRWLAEVERLELRVGGAVELRFGDGEGERVTGTVLALEPPRLLEYEWHFPGEEQSAVRFELTADDRGARLVLDHRLLGAETAAGYGPGWHAHLDALAAHLGGGSIDWLARYRELKPAYEAQLAALP